MANIYKYTHFVFLFLFVVVSPLVSQTAPLVYLIKIDGSINPSTSDFVHKSIEEARNKNAECLVIELNTPGGLLKSTRYIVSDLLMSPVPVVVFVSPSGSQSASAGVFITLAANIAAMAPGTNIGASHPVNMQGGMDSVMSEKATNDAAAFIRSISEKRKRNIKWAEDAVRKSVSITETEALRDSVIDLIANNVNDLLEKIHGREVETSTGKKVLNTKNALIINYEIGWFQKFLGVISDPNIAYILMMIGIWGIILEFYHTGGILPGVVGVICIVLGLYGLHTLPINYAGLALIVLAIILFIAEIKITSYGMLTVGGVISLFLGSFMLIDSDSGLEVAQISLGVIIGTVIIITTLFIMLAYLVIRAHKRKAMTGETGMVGEIGEVFSDFANGSGSVKVLGEIWKAETDDSGEITKGAKVKVVNVKGLTIKVQKI
ncbi:MAG: nodulation protein NfeD [Chlorobi bacterium]|nr:nodulation protein NfeD [Chlorobiota bacterium]MCI0716210.1 nodulation protein NfeD [Chlorobiota bacterium]